MYKHWTVVAADFSREDAGAYVRMNWKDMTPYSVAKGLRGVNPKYDGLSDAEFDAMWYRCTVKEFRAKKEAFLEQEAVEAKAQEAKEAEWKEKIKEIEAKQAAEAA